MKKNTEDWIFLILAILGFLLMSISFLLMPIERLAVLPGVLFWGGLLWGAVMMIVLAMRRRAFYKANGGNMKRMQKRRNGLLSVGSNPEATAADCILLASLLATVLMFVFTKGTGYLCYVCISVACFTVCIRCILNGRLYHYLKNRGKDMELQNELKASKNKKRRKRE